MTAYDICYGSNSLSCFDIAVLEANSTTEIDYFQIFLLVIVHDVFRLKIAM